MLESTVVTALIGTALGFLSGLGVGGGSLLILWLTMVIGKDPAIARGINLLFFIPAAVVSIFIRKKNGTLQLKPLAPVMLAGCLSAAGASWLALSLELALLKKAFGILLLGIGLRELFYRPRKAR